MRRRLMMRSRSITLVQSFDANAGAQRVAAQLVSGLRARGYRVQLWLGFGISGFVSEAQPNWRFMRLERPAYRKIAYPLWLIAANLAMFLPLLRGDKLWANSVASVPASGPFLLFAPRRLIIHLHENNLPSIAQKVVSWAGKRGATVLAVSEHHRQRLEVDGHIRICQVLLNGVGDGELPLPPEIRDELVFVGTAHPMKGLPLFLQVARCLVGSDMKLHVFLAGGPNQPSAKALAEVADAGVQISVGETRLHKHYARAILLLQLTDPALADETFSLVTGEALWHLVPVGGGGSKVLPEVAGAALAFNIESRDADTIATAIQELVADPSRYSLLVDGCRSERDRLALDRFLDSAVKLLDSNAV